MQSLVPAIQIEVLISTLCGLVMLYWQVRAYYRHRQNFFATLATSTVIGMASTLMFAVPYFVRVSENQAITLVRLAIPLVILASILATWGSVQLFRALDEIRR